MYPILLCAGAVSLIVYIREKIRACSVRAVLLKSLVSFLFLAVGIYGAWRGAGAASPLCPFVLLGLLCGLLGDIWLDLKYVFPEKDVPFTYAGFATFGVGHIFYILGMLLAFPPTENPLDAILPFLLGALLSAGNLVLEKPMKQHYGRMRTTVLLYGFLLFGMVLTAGYLALSYQWKETPLNLFFLGGVLFALSDLILSGTYFGTGKDRPIDITLNYLTYYGGQFLIASSLVFLR